MSTIPASELVNVAPSVQGAGGSAVDVIALVLTRSTRPPIGSVLSFPSAAAVSSYFGAASAEAIIAGGGSGMGSGYFGGFDNSNKKPSNILFTQYNSGAVAAYLRGGAVSALSLAQLQAINGTLSILIDAVTKAGSIDLTGVTSFTNAATKIADTLDIEAAPTASFTGSIATTTLTVSAIVSGTLAVGSFIDGAGVNPATYITALGTGTGGTGTYTVSVSQTVGSEAMTGSLPAVTYDSVAGAFVVTSATTGASSTLAFATGTAAASLKLTSATGAVLSQGTIAAVPATFMNAVVVANSNWVNFMTAFDPDNGSGSTVKQAFAAWKNTQNNRFGYVCSDNDASPTTVVPATSSLGYILANNQDSGTCLNWSPSDQNLPAFVCGAAASIDFTQRNGRISFAYKLQSGLVAGVSDPTVATNLGGNPQTSDRGNGYNFYGAYANANQNFTWYQRGFVTGDFEWFDSYVCQVWFNSLCQSALLNLQANSLSIPYSTAGNTLMEAALGDPIQAALNFGLFGPGVLSQAQIADVNAAAGVNIASTLQTRGYYLQILPATPTARAARTTPPAKLWYIDLGSVQAINLASVALL